MRRIMVIEDDMQLRKQLCQILEGYGYQVFAVQEFDRVEELFLQERPELVILDINLPQYDGNYFCRIFRRYGNTPIIVTSARNSEMSQILSIELGADEYIVKPFTIELFLAKVNALVRRIYGDYADIPCDARKQERIQLNERSFKISVNGTTCELSKNEFKLIKVFLLKRNQVITREELLEELWDQSNFVDDNTLTVNITRLRTKLALLGLDDIIKTKRGVGYILDI